MEVGVEVLPAAAPASPPPAVGVVAEVVARVAAPLTVLEVVAANAPDARVVPVALQQGGAVWEEVGMGNAVVLQDDALLHPLEKPGDGAAHPQPAALVNIRV